jgi:D-alanyl-D-alanine carboxypeptidase
MNSKCFFLASTIAFFVTGCSKNIYNANSKLKGPAIDDYTARIDSLVQTKDIRGFNGVIMITQKGIPRYAKAIGYSDLGQKTPLKLKDNFRIQSNSKQITAVLILKEVEKGTIRLEEPIRTYLPDLKQPWADTVTVHQLLNMSAGIVSLEKPLAFKPGTGFHYSNPAYGLLGRIIQKVTGRNFTEAAHDLFKDLGMNNTYCFEMNKPYTGLINGYWTTKDSVQLVDFKSMNFTEESWADFIPAGGIISNAVDLNTWDSKLHNGIILQTASYQAMVTSKVIDADPTFSDKESSYGYGVDVYEEPSLRYIGHSGRGMGFVGLKFYVPARDLDVIILENTYDRDNSKVYHFEKNIRKIVLSSSLVKQ